MRTLAATITMTVTMTVLLLLSASCSMTASTASSGVEADRLNNGIVGGTAVSNLKTSNALSIATSTALLVFDNGQDEVECTAVLVAKDLLLTAAHCFLPYQQPPRRAGWRKFVVFGSRIALKTTAWHTQAQEIGESDYLVNPAYDGSKSFNDIALIHIRKALGAFAVPAKISKTAPKGLSTVAGFGRTTLNGRDATDDDIYVLKSLSVALGKTLAPEAPSTLPVVTSPAATPAGGDSGGPAFTTVNGTRLVWGIDSFNEDAIPNEEFYTVIAREFLFLRAAAKSLGSASLTVFN